jgi:hypothetical protein
VQPEFKARDDAEIAAAAADRPEQVRIFLLTDAMDFAIGRDDICGNQVVDRHVRQVRVSWDRDGSHRADGAGIFPDALQAFRFKRTLICAVLQQREDRFFDGVRADGIVPLFETLARCGRSAKVDADVCIYGH